MFLFIYFVGSGPCPGALAEVRGQLGESALPFLWAISLSGTWCTYWASLVALDNHQKEEPNSFLKNFINLTYFLFVCV